MEGVDRIVEHTLDIRGEICPNTYVYTKLKAEDLLDSGEDGIVLRVLVDHAPATDNIPRTMEEDGHTPLGVREVSPGVWEIMLRLNGGVKRR